VTITTDRTEGVCRAASSHVHGTHYVGGKCLHWLPVGAAYDSLGRSVNNDLGLVVFEHGRTADKSVTSPKSDVMLSAIPAAEKRLGSVSGGRAKPIMSAPSSFQPRCQPTAFEPRVAGYKDSLAIVESGERVATHAKAMALCPSATVTLKIACPARCPLGAKNLHGGKRSNCPSEARRSSGSPSSAV